MLVTCNLKSEGEITDYDLEDAQKNWKNGLAEAGLDSLSLEMVAADDEESQIFAEYIQSQLTENLPGIEITIKTMPSSARFAALSDGDYNLGVLSGKLISGTQSTI